MSHVSPAFVQIFRECMQMTQSVLCARFLRILVNDNRKVLYTERGLPFILAGSGTLGWDQVRGPPSANQGRVH